MWIIETKFVFSWENVWHDEHGNEQTYPTREAARADLRDFKSSVPAELQCRTRIIRRSA